MKRIATTVISLLLVLLLIDVPIPAEPKKGPVTAPSEMMNWALVRPFAANTAAIGASESISV